MNRVVQILPLAGHSNTASIANAVSRLGYEVLQVQADGKISSHLPLIIPGVGTFGRAMSYLRETGLDAEIMSHGGTNAPLLGICLGFQIMFEKGFESSPLGHEGLGLLPGMVVPLRVNGVKRTNIGWHDLPLWKGERVNPKVYFCHSFHVISELPNSVTITLGQEKVLSMGGDGHVKGYQFHPELSGTDGLKILEQDLAHLPAS